MMFSVVVAFLIFSFLLYCLFGGADFGAGIVGIFLPKSLKDRHKDVVKKAMGPVWEANHVWLIIVIVILFVGFPKVFATLTTIFHIPLTLMLIGIVFRGCSFVFRAYDPVQDKYASLYANVFFVSSLVTPFFFGLIIGTLTVDSYLPNAVSFFDLYVYPWVQPFSLLMGLFVVVLFGFVASSFLAAEAVESDLQSRYYQLARRFLIAAILLGTVVFATWYGLNMSTFKAFAFSFYGSALLVGTGVLSAIYLFKSKRLAAMEARVLATGQLLGVALAWLNVKFPIIFSFPNGQTVSLIDAAAPHATLFWLGAALLLGAIFILPGLYVLLRIFKFQ